jgi:hypothetical protein
MAMDPILSLAVTVQSNPGAYALLLGSGTSRSAGIPTGWDVTLDLVRRVAAAAKKDAGSDPAAWYTATFGKAPGYSDLLKEVTRSPAERAQLLRGHFEPDEAEREQGLKVPKSGHHAIARLVAAGYLRLILETNFDHLVEAAIRDAGIEPTIITTTDALKGATPIDRSKCTIVKLHGDYLDTRIRNTEDELARYPRALDRFLDRVFDEFGLIVVGWSGEWDAALRAALERRRSRRYGMYWTTRSEPRELAARLIKQQAADVIRIADADAFLSDLADRVQAVTDVHRDPPLAIDVAVATVKRFIVDPASRIRLNDFVGTEVERAYDLVGGERLVVGAGSISADLVTNLILRAEAATDVLRAVVACGTFWGTGQPDLWVRAIQRLVNRRPPPTQINQGFDLRFVPALLVYYAAGVGAIAGGHYDTLRAICLNTRVAEYEKETPIATWLYPGIVVQQPYGNLLPARGNLKAPMSDYLESALRGSMQHLQVVDPEYTEAFDRFEYLAALVYVDQKHRDDEGGWAPVGQFGWRQGIVAKIGREINEQGVAWPGMSLFPEAVSFDRINKAREVVAETARPMRW